MDSLNLKNLNRIQKTRIFRFSGNSLNFNYIIYIFLIWNAIKLYQIGSTPIIQSLNLLLGLGIYFCLEEKVLKIINKNKLSYFVGLIGIFITTFKFFLLQSTDDKFYYFNLPVGIFFLILIINPLVQFTYLKDIFIISLLLPLRRLFYAITTYLLGSITKYITSFVLFSLGKNHIVEGESIFINNYELVLSKGCSGSDNLYFVICTLVIYMLIFRLKKNINLSIIIFSTIIISIIINTIRNTLLSFIVLSNLQFKDKLFYFFHDSYGSLIFSFISIVIVSWIYFNLLDKELT